MRYNDGMETLMITIFAIFVIALILAGSAWPDIPPVSQYELERRRQQNNRTAIHQLRRIAVYDEYAVTDGSLCDYSAGDAARARIDSLAVYQAMHYQPG